MRNYIQYKAFKTIGELNKWLKNFTHNPHNKEDQHYYWYRNTEYYMLGQIQFLGQADVSGDTGSASVYPVASYLVGDINE